MRASSHIQLKERRQLTLDNFKGVDFSSSPLQVRSNRASEMRNFINEYGVNKKRHGWNELLHIRNSQGVEQPINGIFQYVNGTHKETLVHAGTHFYRIEKSNGKYTYTDITLSSTYAEAKVDLSKLTSTRSQAFFNKGKCYIVGCGDFLVYGSWNGKSYELRKVADNEDTYIPTTTVSIDDDTNETDIRSTLEDINLLSSKRKNQLLGRKFKEGETALTWTLDSGKIDDGTDVFISLDTLEDNVAVTYQIENNTTDKTKLYKTKKDGIEEAPVECGSVDFAAGQIALTISTEPQIEGRDNIFVTFKCFVGGYAERIEKCNFGILFGVGGNTDRLFLSGNLDFANVDFYSEATDFTYFSDRNSTIVGSDSSAIVGFARLSDSALVVYKDENSQDASLFYQTGTYETEKDLLGNPSLVARFSRSAGSIGESVVSRHACANFGGDNIILSRNGVFGIVLADNVATTERYTRERSRSVNERLIRHKNLSEAVGIVYESRYYLAVDDVCYIADSRYKYTSEDNIDGSYNYEWWYWDNVPVRVWAVVDGKLYFGTESGQVCVFDEEYTDRTYQISEEGDLAIDIGKNKVIFNQNINIDLAENDSITITTDGLFSLLQDSCSVENGFILSSEEGILRIYNGMEVFADNVGVSGLEVNKKYTIYSVDKGDCHYQLLDSDGNIVQLSGGGFRLYKVVSNKELYLTNVEEHSFQLKDIKNGNPIVFTDYNGFVPTMPIASFTHRENVVAEWYTPVFDFGTNESSKTLLKMTISTESEVNGKLSFGYETKDVKKLLSAKGINVFSFENFSFENFSFDTGFATSYSVKCKERNFNFIIFRFVSDSEFNCAVNNFTVIYKINKSNKGVR